MKIKKISQSEFDQNSVTSLPIRPNRSSKYGGAGMSAVELQAAFEKTALLIKERLNQLIDALLSEDPEENAVGMYPTGIPEMPTLQDLFSGMTDGTLAAQIRLTADYNLLDFATKLMSTVLPEGHLEFVKIPRTADGYVLPDAPYQGKEDAIYLLPNNNALSLFSSYIWNGAGWELWSSGSLRTYFQELEELLSHLTKHKADRTELTRIQNKKADVSQVLALEQELAAMGEGTPIPYAGSFTELSEDYTADKQKILLLTDPEDPYYASWCYYNGSEWKVGGEYLTDPRFTSEITEDNTHAVSAAAVKHYVDNAYASLVSGFSIPKSHPYNLLEGIEDEIKLGDILTSTGEVTEGTRYYITPLLDIRGLEKLYFYRNTASGIQAVTPMLFVLYDDRGDYIDGDFLSSSQYDIDRVTYPDAWYVRIAYIKSVYENASNMIISPMKKDSFSDFTRYILHTSDVIRDNSQLPPTSRAVAKYVLQNTKNFQWACCGHTPIYYPEQMSVLLHDEKQTQPHGFFYNGKLYLHDGSTDAAIACAPENASPYFKLVLLTDALPNTAANAPYSTMNLGDAFRILPATEELTSDMVLIGVGALAEDGAFSADIGCPFRISDRFYHAGEMQDMNSYRIRFLGTKCSNILSPKATGRNLIFTYASHLCAEHLPLAFDMAEEIRNTTAMAFTFLAGSGASHAERKQQAKTHPMLPVFAPCSRGDDGAELGTVGSFTDGTPLVTATGRISSSRYRQLLGEAAYGRAEVHLPAKDPSGGYFYADFPDLCLRVLCLSTADLPATTSTLSTEDTYINKNGEAVHPTSPLTYYTTHSLLQSGFGAAQLRFVADEALHFDTKEDPEAWSVLVLQDRPSTDLSAQGFPSLFVEDNGQIMEDILSAFAVGSDLVYTADGTTHTASFSPYGKGKIHAVISTGGDRIVTAEANGLFHISLPVSGTADLPLCHALCLHMDENTLRIATPELASPEQVGKYVDFTDLSLPNTFSAAKEQHTPPFLCNVYAQESILLQNGGDYRLQSYFSEDGTPTLSLSLGASCQGRFQAILTLPAVSAAPQIHCPESILFSGDDVDDEGYFQPLAGKRYTIFFRDDGMQLAFVHAVTPRTNG